MNSLSDKIDEVSADELQGVWLDLYDANGVELERVVSANVETGRIRYISGGFEGVGRVPAPLTLIHPGTGCKIEYWQQIEALYRFNVLAKRLDAKWEAMKRRQDERFASMNSQIRRALGPSRVLCGTDAVVQVITPDGERTLLNVKDCYFTSSKSTSNSWHN